MRIRSMVLVSNDTNSLQRNSQEVYLRFQRELEAFDLGDEISLSTLSDVGRNDVLPMVVVYPDAVVYGPVQPEDVHLIVEEHLYKGRVVESLLAPKRELSGRIAWLHARKGTVPAEQRVVLQTIWFDRP